jgi:hypothetical protein
MSAIPAAGTHGNLKKKSELEASCQEIVLGTPPNSNRNALLVAYSEVLLNSVSARAMRFKSLARTSF